MTEILPPEMIYEIFDAISDEDIVAHTEWITDKYYLKRRINKSFGIITDKFSFVDICEAVYGQPDWAGELIWLIIEQSTKLSYTMFDKLCYALNEPLDAAMFLSEETSRATTLIDAANVVVDNIDDSRYLKSFLKIFFYDSTYLGNGAAERAALELIINERNITVSFVLDEFLAYVGMESNPVVHMRTWIDKNEELYHYLHGVSLLLPYLIRDIVPYPLDEDTFDYLYTYDASTADEGFEDDYFMDYDDYEEDNGEIPEPIGDPRDTKQQLLSIILVVSSRPFLG